MSLPIYTKATQRPRWNKQALVAGVRRTEGREEFVREVEEEVTRREEELDEIRGQGDSNDTMGALSEIVSRLAAKHFCQDITKDTTYHRLQQDRLALLAERRDIY
eukprot:311903-Pyramimonas_sp.AAC.1